MLHFLKKHGRKIIVISLCISAVFALFSILTVRAMAAEDDNNLISIGISAGDGSDLASVLQMLLVLTVISLAPSILMLVTSFTRIVIVMHFTRAALGTQTVPPNQVIVGLSLFLTFFIMAPTFNEVYQSAIEPLTRSEVTAEEAFDIGVKPLRQFMLKQVSTKDLDTFLRIAEYEEGSITSEDDIPLRVLIPSFIKRT